MTMLKKACQCCGKEFSAREADVNRGWAKFCSKSCKARAQEAKTGQYKAMLRRAARNQEHPFSSDAIGQW